MPKILTLDGAALGAPSRKVEAGCKCVMNPRTKRGTLLCPVPKSKKHRSGWSIRGRCDK